MNIGKNTIRINVGRYFRLLVCAAILVLNGCTTTMNGGLASNDKPGIRYSLPAPHIFMNPQPDGTVIVEVKYLPDPNNTYTLSLNSYLSSATFDVQLNDGMLTKLSLDANSSAIPTKAVTAATEIQKQSMAAKQTKKKAKQEKEDASKAPPEPAKSGESKTNAFNSPKTDDALKNALGPVFFRVLPTEAGGVKLVALEKQQTYETSASGQSDATSSSLTFTPPKVIVKKGTEDFLIVFEFSKPIIKIDQKNARLVRPADGRNAEPFLEGGKLKIQLVKPELKTMELVLPKETPLGDYRLEVSLQAKGTEREMKSLPIKLTL